MTPPTSSEPIRRARVDRRQFLAGTGSMVAGSIVAGAGLVADPFGAPGVSAAPAGAGSFLPLPAQRRIADTRNPAVYPFVRLTDRRIRVGIVGVPGVPASATAAVLTVTVVNRSAYNFVTRVPGGSRRSRGVEPQHRRPRRGRRQPRDGPVGRRRGGRSRCLRPVRPRRRPRRCLRAGTDRTRPRRAVRGPAERAFASSTLVRPRCCCRTSRSSSTSRASCRPTPRRSSST